MNPTRSTSLRWLAASLMAGTLLFASCAQPEEDPPSAEQIQAEIDQRVTRLIIRSEDHTTPEEFPYPDGGKGVRRVAKPRELSLPRGSWNLPSSLDLTTPGDVVQTFPLTEWPQDLAIDNRGAILVATEAHIRVHRLGEEEPDLLSDRGARSLQWHPQGDRILVSGPWESAMYQWPDGKKLFDIQIAAPGLLQFSPDGERLWSVKNAATAEEILSAGEAVRVRLLIEVYPAAGATTSSRTMETPDYAMVGTLPGLGTVWGHQARPYQLDPWPAPLVRLNEALRLTGTITQTASTVDLDPQFGAPEFVYFVRANQRGGRSSRAWMISSNDHNLERCLTAEPTYDIAISPDGTRVALLLTRNDQGVLLRTTREALFARNLEPAVTARTQFEQQAQSALAHVRQVFTNTEMGRTQRLGDHGWEVEWPPEDGLMIVMDRAVRAALKDQVGLDLARDFEALGQLDDFLAEADGLWPEEPATVVALAALYGSVLDTNPDVDWHLETSLPAMSEALQDFTVGDGLMYSLHSPFLVARERLQGRALLDATARELLTRWERPIAMVENFQENTVDSFLGRLAAAGGLPQGASTQEAIESAALRSPDNDVVQMLARSIALRYGDRTLETVAAFNLAENNPASGRALVMAAQAAQRMMHEKAALKLYDHAARVAPDDLDVMLAVALGYFDENLFDEAEGLFEHVLRIDDIGLAREVVEENLAQLRALRDAEHTDQESE